MSQGLRCAGVRYNLLILTASDNSSRFSKQTQLASITAQDFPLRAALIIRSENLLTKWYNTQLRGEIRKAKLIKYENDIPCVTYRSCELWRDNEPFEKFRVGLPDCGGIYIPERDLQSIPSKISDRGDVFSGSPSSWR
jgi:hypothetical protein